jgi:flagellar hook-length control protein FliK
MLLLRTTTKDAGTAPLPGALPAAEAERAPGAREFPATLDAVIARRERPHARPKSGSRNAAAATDGDGALSAARDDAPDLDASDSGAASCRAAELSAPIESAQAAPTSVCDDEPGAATADAATVSAADAGGIAATLEDTRRAAAFGGGTTTAIPAAAVAVSADGDRIPAGGTPPGPAAGATESPAGSTHASAGGATEGGEASAATERAGRASVPTDPTIEHERGDGRSARANATTREAARPAAIAARGATAAAGPRATSEAAVAVTSRATAETPADATPAGTASATPVANDASSTPSTTPAAAADPPAVDDGSAAEADRGAAVDLSSGARAPGAPADVARAAASAPVIRDDAASPAARGTRIAPRAGARSSTGPARTTDGDASAAAARGGAPDGVVTDGHGAPLGGARASGRAPVTDHVAVEETAARAPSDATPSAPAHVHTRGADREKASEAGAGGAQTSTEQHAGDGSEDTSGAALAASASRSRVTRPGTVATATTSATSERGRAQSDVDAGTVGAAADRGHPLPAQRVASPAPVATPALHAERAPGLAAWAERIADSVRFSALNGEGEMRVRLEPAGLGSIDIRVSMQHDGVRAVIVAEHESTRRLLSEQRHVLQAALDRSELRLSGFSVDTGAGGGSGAAADPHARSALARARVGEDPIDRDGDVAIVAALPVTAPAGRLSVRV